VKQYNLVSVCNKQYTPFLKVFLGSALNILDSEKLNKIYILDTGVEKKTKDFFSSIDYIEFIDSKSTFESEKPWDDGWKKNVLMKTQFTKDILKKDNLPTMMVDIDSMFIQEISDLMEHECDIMVCNRASFSPNFPIIASYVGFFDVEKGISFLDLWMDDMKLPTQHSTVETPSLNNIVRKNDKTNYFKMMYTDFSVVGLYRYTHIHDQTKILHFKGGGFSEGKETKVAIDLRFKRFINFMDIIDGYLNV
tara:strand:- start:2822 stop:3571 length:750 start_codon:yes stop_codon:yes gene_type:complete